MIARDLGRTHAQLLEDLSGFELARWKALYAVEGKERDEARADQAPKPRRR